MLVWRSAPGPVSSSRWQRPGRGARRRDGPDPVDARCGDRPSGDGPDAVVVASDALPRTLALLDRRTGQERWTAPAPPGSVGGLAVDTQRGAGRRRVIDRGLRRQDRPAPPRPPDRQPPATPPWRASSTAWPPGSRAPAATPNATQAYDAATGQHLWTSPGYPPQRPEPTDGNVYVVVDAGVAALDPHTGAVRWTVEGSNLEAGPGLALTSQPAMRPTPRSRPSTRRTGRCGGRRRRASSACPASTTSSRPASPSPTRTCCRARPACSSPSATASGADSGPERRAGGCRRGDARLPHPRTSASVSVRSGACRRRR